MDKKHLNRLVQEALEGDKASLEKLIVEIQGYVYNLAVRFYWNPPDAQDATQEILVKIITNLSKFEGKSTFTTWMYRLVTNYLLNAKRSEAEALTFEEGAEHLSKGLEFPGYDLPDRGLLEEEVKISCTTSMLVCLSRPMRLAYLIGEILEFDSNEGSFILGIDPATFRKRLSLARQKIRDFMGKQCGLYNPANPCRCHRQISYSLDVAWFDRENLNFADKGVSLTHLKEEIDAFIDEVAIFHSHPQYQAPTAIYQEIKEMIESGRHSFLG